MFEIAPFVTVPLPPLVTMQVWDGIPWVRFHRDRVRRPALGRPSAKSKVLAPSGTVRVGSPAVTSVSPVPARPEIAPPTWYVLVAQVTTMSGIVSFVTVPLPPLATVQV